MIGENVLFAAVTHYCNWPYCNWPKKPPLFRVFFCANQMLVFVFVGLHRLSFKGAVHKHPNIPLFRFTTKNEWIQMKCSPPGKPLPSKTSAQTKIAIPIRQTQTPMICVNRYRTERNSHDNNSTIGIVEQSNN